MSQFACIELDDNVKLKRKSIIDKLGLLDRYDDDKHFQDVVTSVAFLTNSTAAYFSLLTDECQIIKSAFGFVPARISPKATLFDGFNSELKESVCCLTLKLSPTEPLIIPDTHLHPMLSNNRFVIGPPYLRFYAGFPVQYEGINIGTLCAGDSTPRKELKPSVITNIYLLRDKLNALLIQRELKLQKRKKWFGLF